MGKIIKFPDKIDEMTPELIRLKKVSDQIDRIIVENLEQNTVDSHEMIGILAHRLGTLLRNMEKKRELWQVCQEVICDQSHLEKKD